MTAHELAELLLKQENLPVGIYGWGMEEGFGPFEVASVEKDNGILLLDYDHAWPTDDRSTPKK